MDGFIYRATCKTTGLCYIGQTIDISKRKQSHWKKRKDGSKFHTALLQYGKDDFEWDILEKCDESMLNEKEVYWINYYDSFNNGYNSDIGGGITHHIRYIKHTQNTIDNIRKKCTNPSEDKRQIMRAAKLGKQTWMKGKHHTPEAKEKNRQAHFGSHRVYHPDGTWHMEH